VKFFCKIIGYFALGLGFIGIFVPLLPTTPLILLAAFCFVRSSKKMHNRLLKLYIFGDIIRSYHEKRKIPWKAVIFSLVFIWSSIICTIVFFVKSVWLTVFLLAIAVSVSVHILYIQKIRK